MKHSLSSLQTLLAGLLVLATGPLPAQPAAPAQPALEAMAWLSGCWAPQAAKEGGSFEHWSAPAGGTLLGMSRTVRGGKTVGFEFMVLRRNAEGVWVYTAKPSGQAEASFTLVRQGEGELVFENLGHDFPQRIIYRRGEAGQLLARIEGLRAGVLRDLSFPMQKAVCP